MKISDKAALFIAQGAYSGRFPVAPGTAGTLAGVLLYLGVTTLSLLAYLGLCILLCLIGSWTAGRAEVLLRAKDSPSIVIDEIAGYFIAMFLIPAGWGYIVAGFILFRIFDIAKPWPLNSLQRVRGGLGVMLDDIGAGIYANLILQAAICFLKR